MTVATEVRQVPPPGRDPMVLTYLVGVAVSWFGDAVWVVALAWTAAHTLSPTLAGVVLGAEMLPQAALVLVGGVIADRFDPRRVVLAGQVARVVVLGGGAAAWTAGLDGAATLLALALGFGVAAGLTIPSGNALVRQLVAKEHLGTVLGWNQVSGRLMRLLGAPVGGVVVAVGGPVAAMLLDATTFLVIAVITALVLRPRYSLPRASEARWRESFVSGMRYLRSTPTARLFVIGLTALNVFVTPITALGLALRVEGSGWGAHWLGFADGALAAGAIVGSLAAIRWRPPYAAASGFRVLVVQGLALAAVGVAWQPAVMAGMVVVGFTAGLASVWLSAAFLAAIDPAYTGRVSSVTALGDMTLLPLSVPVMGYLSGAVGLLPTTIAFGASMSLLCLWFATRPALSHLRSGSGED